MGKDRQTGKTKNQVEGQSEKGSSRTQDQQGKEQKEKLKIEREPGQRNINKGPYYNQSKKKERCGQSGKGAHDPNFLTGIDRMYRIKRMNTISVRSKAT